MMPEADDFDLLEAWRSGDSRAGDALFARHFERIYRFFKSKVADEADELTQRTFLALIENRKGMRSDSHFRAYAFGIARNQLLMHFRRRTNLRETELVSGSIADLTSGGVEFGLLKGEELRLVLRAMQSLPLDFQVALELFYWEDMAIRDIADVLELSAGTVKSRLFRSRELLRREIESLDAPEALRQSTLGELQRWLDALQRGLGAG